MPRLPINQWDTGKTAREKINESWNELLNAVENFRPHIENGVWWIGNLNTWISAEGKVYFKTEDGYFKYKTSTTERENVLDLESLKVKGDTGVGIDDISSENKGEYTLITITLSNRERKTINLPNGRDGVWTWDMQKSANLSDLADKNVARTNLSVYSKSEVDTKLWVKQNTSEKNQANGYAGLDNNKKLDPSVIPVIATTETVVVANKTARLALTTAQVQRGDYAIQTDSGEKFILSGNNPQQEGHRTLVADTTPDWSQIDNKPSAFTPATHTHTKEQVGLGNVDNTSDATKNSATATLTNKTINGDNNTITKVNSLKNQNGNTEIKTRAGTKAQHTAVGTKDENTLYLITDS